MGKDQKRKQEREKEREGMKEREGKRGTEAKAKERKKKKPKAKKELGESLRNDLFKKDETENLPPSPGQEDCQQTENFGLNSPNDGISLRPDFSWK